MQIKYYLEINLLCMIVLFLIRWQMSHHNRILPTNKMMFLRILDCVILFSLCDAVAGACRGADFAGVRILLKGSNLLYFELITVIGYLWMRYVHTELQLLNPKKDRLLAIPLLLFTAVALADPFTNFLFSIDENNLYVRGNGVYFHWIICWFYLIFSTVEIALAVRREKNKSKRREMVPLLNFIVAPLIASLVQMFFYGVSSTQVGFLVSLLIIFFSMQNKQIFVDELTQLNNRHGLNRYLEETAIRDAKKELCVMMLDLNGFKQINDKLGHMTGDRALQDTAELLKTVCGQMGQRLFLCRYGGDEFLVIGHDCTHTEIAETEERIHLAFEKKSSEEDLPYRLAVSIGVAWGKCRNTEDVDGLIRRADESMYAQKAT